MFLFTGMLVEKQAPSSEDTMLYAKWVKNGDRHAITVLTFSENLLYDAWFILLLISLIMIFAEDVLTAICPKIDAFQFESKSFNFKNSIFS